MGDPYGDRDDQEGQSSTEPSRRLFTLMAWLVPLQTIAVFAVIGFVLDDDLEGFPVWLWIVSGLLLAVVELVVLLYVRRRLPSEDHTPGTFRL